MGDTWGWQMGVLLIVQLEIKRELSANHKSTNIVTTEISSMQVNNADYNSNKRAAYFNDEKPWYWLSNL